MKLPQVTHPLLVNNNQVFTINGRSRGGVHTANWPIASRSLSLDGGSRGHHHARRSTRGGNRSTGAMTSLDGSVVGDRKLTVDEIVDVIEEKLQKSNGFNEIKKLFRSNDPNGEGKISKEAFARVIWCLCGYTAPTRINALLKRLNLHQKAQISFADLIAFYRQKEENAGESPAQHQVTCLAHVGIPEDETLKKWNLLKEEISKNNVDFITLFPPSCFSENAFILPGQMRECFEKMKIEITTAELVETFRRICGNPYAIKSKLLLQHFQPKPTPTEQLNNKNKKTTHHKPPLSERFVASAPVFPAQFRHNKTAPSTSAGVLGTGDSPNVRIGPPPSTSPPDHAVEVEVITSSLPPKFEGNLIEFMTKKLEEGHFSVIESLASKDRDQNGMISKTHLRHIFKSLGFHVKAIQLEHFLSRLGIRRKDGLVNYQLLLRRLQTRTRLGLLSKVMRTQTHIFHSSTEKQKQEADMSAETLECRLIGIFHKNFFLLLSSFKEADSNHSGMLHIDQTRSVLEDHFSMKISEKSWRSFVSSSFVQLINLRKTYDPDGAEKTHVSYNQLLSKFDVTKSSDLDDIDPWIEEMDISYLREHKVRYLYMMSADPANHSLRHDPQPLEVLERQMVEVLLNKFDTFKKEYDLAVREDYCRVDKEKFDYVMFRCGFILTPSELHRLWLSMPITRPMESLSFKTILQHSIRLFYSNTRPDKFKRSTEHSVIVEYLLERIKKQVIQHWDKLKKAFRSLDPCGTSRVFKHQFVEVLEGINVKINSLELYYIVETLESRIREKSDYMKMLGYYVKKQQRKRQKGLSNTAGVFRSNQQHKSSVPILRNRMPQYKVYPTNMDPETKKKTVRSTHLLGKSQSWEVEKDPHPELSTMMSDTSAKSLMRRKVKPFIHGTKIGSLTRMLRKQDEEKTGKIPVKSFLDVLGSHGVSIQDPNDLYKLLSCYDQNLKKEISYGKFLKTLA